MAFDDGPDLVSAVDVDGRERELGGLASAHVDGDLAVPMAHDQLAAAPHGGQGERQGRDHPVGLLGVTVRRD